MSCDPVNYVTQKHYFKQIYALEEVHAPAYPASGEDQNPIKISFPKQEEFSLQLSANTCGGTYKAKQDGTISFSNTNCTEMCCDSDWDYYILTLIRKATRFEGGEETPLILYIDKDNYLTFAIEKQELTVTSRL
ncbi:META domain-containing protein [uncultured Carboxylicivirga sp.]|nr:META domain-containing protein [uncultured Carboxylicivirga sp.]